MAGVDEEEGKGVTAPPMNLFSKPGDPIFD